MHEPQYTKFISCIAASALRQLQCTICGCRSLLGWVEFSLPLRRNISPFIPSSVHSCCVKKIDSHEVFWKRVKFFSWSCAKKNASGTERHKIFDVWTEFSGKICCSAKEVRSAKSNFIKSPWYGLLQFGDLGREKWENFSKNKTF